MNFMKSLPYYDDLTARQTIKLRELIKTLPPFAKEFFRAIDSTTQVRTRIAYAYDLRVFFHFLIDENPAYRNYSVLDFKVSDLDKIESVDLEEYMEYLKFYISKNNISICRILNKVCFVRCLHERTLRRRWRKGCSPLFGTK